MSTGLVATFKNLTIAKNVNSLTREQSALATQWESITKNGTAELQENLDQLNLFLRDNSFLCATQQPTVTDVIVFEPIFPIVKQLVSSTKDIKDVYNKYRHILRWSDFLQQLLSIPQSSQLSLNYDLELTHEIIEKKKKPAVAAAAADAKTAEATTPAAAKDKPAKEAKGPRGKPDEETLKKLREEAKAKKAAKKAAQATAQAEQAKKADEMPSPSIIDFRVGFIQKAIKHPDADSLYVSTIDVGDAEGPRTVCSGLVKHFPLEAMQERYVVVVCNLKPVNMRGIKSTAMVLCASTDEKVEFVEPPKGSKAGDKVFFEGLGDEEPLKQLNPKKKLWEKLQPLFSTTSDLNVVFKDEENKKDLKLTNAKGEDFKVASLVDAQVR
ncbi:Arc1p NDAI_0F02040 [Naumovozyma dairenensis CBS 421]|uniref:tRNA-binding domain-containing protein n=1 Tax=Naumovozyma dairenensis (strain ATCC 10597 / BCRC 20456 / CBS 421 / NBRC 0211 / NRRL Y-12639) TaxID=1071378 RepID=G0WCL1_NAUDC|nr:hypothetical protein NDAI_0F02040 [Naumovozyma dairenensis CBS 421]CCD25522.1 hypothetical protein NDAI_0F02040 [Naumovozyma dairenensis CBS 421]